MTDCAATVVHLAQVGAGLDVAPVSETQDATRVAEADGAAAAPALM